MIQPIMDLMLLLTKMNLNRLQPRKGSIWLYVGLLTAAIAAMLLTRQCSYKPIGPKVETIAGGDTLNVAIEISPASYYFSGDSLNGEYYNLLRKISSEAPDSAPLPMHFIPFTRVEDAVKWLDEGKCRMVVGDIPVTAELREKYIFVDPVALDRQVLVQLRDTLKSDTLATGSTRFIHNQFELGGREVRVAKGSPYVKRLRNLSREIGDTIYVVEDMEYSSEQLAILTAAGEVPLTVVSESTAKSLASYYPNLDYSVAVSLNQFQSFLFLPSDSLLRDRINDAIRQAMNK